MTTEHPKPRKHPTYTCGEPIHIGDIVRSKSNDVTGTIVSLGRHHATVELKGEATILVPYNDLFIKHNHVVAA